MESLLSLPQVVVSQRFKMEIILVVAFIVSNAGWLYYLNRRDTRDKTERFQLLDRNLFPDKQQIPPMNLPTKGPEAVPFEVVPDEFDLVGEVNPPTPLRND